MIDRLVKWLVDWLIDWWIDWLVHGLIGWSIDWLIEHLILYNDHLYSKKVWNGWNLTKWFESYKWSVVYTWLKYPSVVRWSCYFLLLLAHFALSRWLRPRAATLFSYSVEQNARDTKVITRVTEGAIRERSPLACALACTPLTKSEEKERLFAVYCELLFTANFDFSLLDSWCHQKISIMRLWNKLSRQN